MRRPERVGDELFGDGARKLLRPLEQQRSQPGKALRPWRRSPSCRSHRPGCPIRQPSASRRSRRNSRARIRAGRLSHDSSRSSGSCGAARAARESTAAQRPGCVSARLVSTPGGGCGTSRPRMLFNQEFAAQHRRRAVWIRGGRQQRAVCEQPAALVGIRQA